MKLCISMSCQALGDDLFYTISLSYRDALDEYALSCLARTVKSGQTDQKPRQSHKILRDEHDDSERDHSDVGRRWQRNCNEYARPADRVVSGEHDAAILLVKSIWVFVIVCDVQLSFTRDKADRHFRDQHAARRVPEEVHRLAKDALRDVAEVYGRQRIVVPYARALSDGPWNPTDGGHCTR